MCPVAFPTGQDSATFQDKGTEVPSLSRDKRTTGQAQNLGTGRDRTGFCNNFFPMISCFRTSFPVLERTFPILERPFLF